MYQWFIQWHYHILKYNFWSYSTLWHFWLPLHIELIFFIKLPEVTASLLMALVNLGVSNICYRFTLFFLLGICQNWISSTAMLSIHQVVMFLYFLSALVGLNWYVSLVKTSLLCKGKLHPLWTDASCHINQGCALHFLGQQKGSNFPINPFRTELSADAISRMATTKLMYYDL